MNKRYNVLWITSWYPNATDPVAGIFVREHARATHLFDNVTVIHLMERQTRMKGLWKLVKESDPNIHSGIPTYHYASKQLHFPIISELISFLGIFRSIATLSRQNTHIDLLHAHTYRAGLRGAIISSCFGIPMVITEHSSIFLSEHLTRLKRIKAQIAFKTAKVVMPVSDFLKRSIQAHGISANFSVVGNTYDPEIFYFSPEKSSSKILQMITVCYLNPNKRIDLLLKALARLPKSSPAWNLHIVGTGPQELQLRSLVHQLGIQDEVKFLGTLTKTQVAEALRQADFFVLPSHHETFSVATLEALACGLPVLVTKSGGPEEFVSDDLGIVVPRDDSDALQAGLQKMLVNSKEFNRQRIASQVRQKYGFESIGLQIHNIYASLLG